MRSDFNLQHSQPDEVHQCLRLARITRGVIGAVIVAAIGFMVVASLPQSAAERNVHDASVNEMQMYAVPPDEGIREVTQPRAASSATGTSDDEMRSLTGVVDHG